MSSSPPITFVVAVNDREVLKANLLASPCLQGAQAHQLILQERFPSASLAYNDALSRATGEIVVFIHQDVFLPSSWTRNLETALQKLAERDPNWAVLGCWGVNRDGDGVGHVYTPGQGTIGRSFEDPLEVQTLDELVLIVRKSSGLRFDEGLTGFHLYGTDLCLQAAKNGLTSYAISAFCIHNAQQYFQLPPEFVDCYRQVKRAWRKFLPIHTSCVTISASDWELYRLRARLLWDKVAARRRDRGRRVVDPRLLLKENQ